MARKATAADLPIYQKIWEEAFGDSPAFSQMVFEKFAGVENVFVAEENGAVVSILAAVPCTLKGYQGAYFYGLATQKSSRGRGHMANLMDYAETQLRAAGVRFVTLIPAEPGLFDYYERTGFQKAFGLRQLSRPIKRNLWAQAEFDSRTAHQLMELRRKYCPDSVLLTPQGMIEELTDLYSSGVTVVCSSEGYALYFLRGDTLEVVEIFAEGERAAELLLEAAREKVGAENAVITVNERSNLFLGEGKRRDYGMIKFLAEPFDLYECYMRLMLDN